MGQGKKTGIVSALGIGAGTLVHTCVAAFGLAAILVSLPIAFQIIKFVGAAYLVFLGLRMLLNKSANFGNSLGSKRGAGLWVVFRQGVATNVFNPKVTLFFLAFLPQFVDPARGQIVPQIVLLGLIFDASGTTWNIVIASIAGQAGNMLSKRSWFSRLQKILPGAILIALGILVAFR